MTRNNSIKKELLAKPERVESKRGRESEAVESVLPEGMQQEQADSSGVKLDSRAAVKPNAKPAAKLATKKAASFFYQIQIVISPSPLNQPQHTNTKQCHCTRLRYTYLCLPTFILIQLKR